MRRIDGQAQTPVSGLDRGDGGLPYLCYLFVQGGFVDGSPIGLQRQQCQIPAPQQLITCGQWTQVPDQFVGTPVGDIEQALPAGRALTEERYEHLPPGFTSGVKPARMVMPAVPDRHDERALSAHTTTLSSCRSAELGPKVLSHPR